jgi:hypothetical protein
MTVVLSSSPIEHGRLPHDAAAWIASAARSHDV